MEPLVLLSPPVERTISFISVIALQNLVDLHNSPPSSILNNVGLNPIFFRQPTKNIIIAIGGDLAHHGKANGYLEPWSTIGKAELWPLNDM